MKYLKVANVILSFLLLLVLMLAAAQLGHLALQEPTTGVLPANPPPP